MQIKHNVNVNGMKPEILLATIIAKDVYLANGVEMVITSVTDGNHGDFSRHFLGMAVDLRTRNIPGESVRQKIIKELKYNLGPQYKVLDEKTHFHISFKPKDPPQS